MLINVVKWQKLRKIVLFFRQKAVIYRQLLLLHNIKTQKDVAGLLQ
jgi:hypothetical protein